ncbi:MAG: Gfo/Idh/MocA family oxidoreductase [Planctomycetota bacterium]|jgi:predicted dehydrogenase|nr:Gfo/Idh/MocA family oxidoreductase [Planctomycetota bacterium]
MVSERKSIGVGLVGTGFMAKAHANAFNTIPYMFPDLPLRPRLAAVASTSLERAEETARRYGFEKALVGHAALIDDPEVELVDVANGDRLHAAVALAALAKGKHVLCEKPLADNLADAKRLAEAAARAEKSGVKAVCGFNYRFVPAVALAKRLIERGVIGRVYSFNGCYLQDSGAFEDTPAEKVWYAAPGGPKNSGVMYGIGTHLIDQARYLAGEIETVAGSLRTYNTRRDSAAGKIAVRSDEDGVAVVGFANGALGSIRAAAVAAGRKNRLSWEISGSRGTLFFDLEEINYLKVFLRDTPVKEVSGFTRVNVTQLDRNHPFMDIWWPRGHGIGWEHAHINEAAHLLARIAEDGPVGPEAATFEDGYQALRVVEAVRRSEETGMRQRVEDIGP